MVKQYILFFNSSLLSQILSVVATMNHLEYQSKIIPITYNAVVIQLEVDMNVGIGGETWPAADQFCSLISTEKHFDFFSNLFRNKRIIEFGSGTGIVSILICQLYQSVLQVVASDLLSHLPLIEKNISSNVRSSVDSSDHFEPKCIAKEYDWVNRPLDHVKYDIVLAFECVYREDLFIPLIESIDAVSHSNTIIFLGLTRLFAKPCFFQLLTKYMFKYTMIPKNNFNSKYSNEYESRDVALFVLHKQLHL